MRYECIQHLHDLWFVHIKPDFLIMCLAIISHFQLTHIIIFIFEYHLSVGELSLRTGL